MSSLPPSKALLIVISAPSGAGKTRLCSKVLESCPNVQRAITCTTRAPRGGERDGVDYHFLNMKVFESKIAVGAFLEHAEVYGRRYGTLLSEITDRLSTGHDVLLNIDVQGAASIRAKAAGTPAIRDALVSVFLAPPSMAELERRLRARAEDDEEAIRKRLTTAAHEMAQWAHFDYLLTSETLDPAQPDKDEDLRRMLCIIEAEKLRQSRTNPPV
jgi:guanylate kinase